MKNKLFLLTLFSTLVACDVEDFESHEYDSEFRAIVSSNGTKVGYLLDSTRFTYSMMSLDKKSLFLVNPETGYMAGAPIQYYSTPDCSGGFYIASGISPNICPAWSGREILVSDSQDVLGLTLPQAVYTSAGFFVLQQGSVSRNGVCQALVGPQCVSMMVITNQDPVFDLPIKISF